MKQTLEILVIKEFYRKIRPVFGGLGNTAEDRYLKSRVGRTPMGNEDEFFGFAAKLRSWTHPLNRRYPWLRYVLAVVSIGAFWALMRISGEWSWVVVTGWVILGLIWFQIFSRWRDFWWGRKRESSVVTDVIHGLAEIVLILVGSFVWPLWMAFGEDMFD